MNEAILIVLGVTVTPWKLAGFAGTALFTLRWLIQAHATRRAGEIRIPVSFWWLSLTGSALTLLYFVFGKNDSVGIYRLRSPCFPRSTTFGCICGRRGAIPSLTYALTSQAWPLPRVEAAMPTAFRSQTYPSWSAE